MLESNMPSFFFFFVFFFFFFFSLSFFFALFLSFLLPSLVGSVHRLRLPST